MPTEAEESPMPPPPPAQPEKWEDSATFKALHPEKREASAEFKALHAQLLRLLTDPLNTQLPLVNGHIAIGQWGISTHELHSDKPEKHPLGHLLRIFETSRGEGYSNSSPLPFQIVARKTKDGQINYIGIIHRTPTSEIFIPRPENMDLSDFANSILQMLQKEQSYVAKDGHLRFEWAVAPEISNETREGLAEFGIATSAHLSKVGIHKPDDFLQLSFKPPHPLDIPASILRSTTRRVRSVVSENDSFGKQQWRATMAEKFQEIFPGGYDSIPENERLVLCFPGAGGKEADFWIAQGFQQEDLVMIERDTNIIAQLRKKYPHAAAIIKTNVGHPCGRTLEQRIFGSNRTMGYLIKRCRFSVLSFDPEGGLTQGFLSHMWNMPSVYAPKTFFSANFNLKRETADTIMTYQQVGGFCNHNFFASACDETRQQVMAALPDFIADHVPAKVLQKWHGHYEGDSDSTRMFWAMAHFDKSA